MKKLFLLAVIVIPSITFGQSQGELPYKAIYASDFQITHSKNIKIVLDGWKSFELNKVNENDGTVSDTIRMEMVDGTVIKGRQNFYNTIKKLRGAVKDLKVTMRAYMGIKTLNTNDDLVLIWADESFTGPDGKKSIVNVQQVWGFDKAGKVSFLKDYQAKQL